MNFKKETYRKCKRSIEVEQKSIGRKICDKLTGNEDSGSYLCIYCWEGWEKYKEKLRTDRDR